MRGKGKGRTNSTAGKASGSRGSSDKSVVSKKNANNNNTRSTSPSVSSATTPAGPEWPYDKYYGDIFTTIADAPNEGHELPDMSLLKKLQHDLSTLVTSSSQRISVCDARMNKLKRVDSLVNEERNKRARKTAKTNNSKEEDASNEGEEKNEAASSRGAAGRDNETGTEVYEDKQGDVIMGDASTVNNVIKKEEQTEEDEEKTEKEKDMTSMQEEFRQHSPDDYEKNPKSEYVESQVLPIAALNLFEHAVAGLPQTGEEYLKKKYGVASYPTTDLKDMLPGEIPDKDFSKAKPPNQVQFSTFAAAIEPYFRNYTEEDLSFLNQKAVGGDSAYTRPGLISPYVTPPLGPSYVEVWAQEDGPNPGYTLTPLSSRTDMSRLKPKGSSERLSDTNIELANEVSCGPLASRLLSAIMEDPDDNNNGDDEDDETEQQNNESSIVDTNWKINAVSADYTTLEDRLKREFRYVGILDVNMLKSEQKKKQQFRLATAGAKNAAQPTTTTVTANSNNSSGNKNNNNSSTTSNGSTSASSTAVTATNGTNTNNINSSTANSTTNDEAEADIDWINSKEDDEICYEMRMLQKKLRAATKVNQACKHKLIPMVEEEMAYQEYTQILDDLDKQVDQAYVKKIRNPKNKKKKSSTTSSNSTGTAVSVDQKASSIKPLLSKRSRWIEKIGPVFPPAEIMKRVPSESIFKELPIDNEDDDEYNGGLNEEEDLYGI